MQWSIWSKRVEKDNQLYATIQSNKVWRNINFRSNGFHSQPSKHLEFVSRQRHHIKWWRIAFQISMHWYCPNPTYQQASSSVTPLGIAHWIPKRLNTIDHNSLALEQCNTKWSTITNFIQNKMRQRRTTLTNIFPQTYTIGTRYCTSTPTTPHTSMLCLYHLPPKNIPFKPKSLQPLPKQSFIKKSQISDPQTTRRKWSINSSPFNWMKFGFIPHTTPKKFCWSLGSLPNPLHEKLCHIFQYDESHQLE